MFIHMYIIYVYVLLYIYSSSDLRLHTLDALESLLRSEGALAPPKERIEPTAYDPKNAHRSSRFTRQKKRASK